MTARTATPGAPDNMRHLVVGDVFYEDGSWQLVTFKSKSGAIRYHEIAWWRAWPRLLWNWVTG